MQKFEERGFDMGALPPQAPELLEEEFSIFRAEHPEWDETQARRQFDVIQVMSARGGDKIVAAWAERKALANAWLKSEIMDVYDDGTLPDEALQAAIDAYAFDSGHPSLVTVSHLLVKPDSASTPEMRRAALEKIRRLLLAREDFSDERLRDFAQLLLRDGFHAETDGNLTFPQHQMPAFMGQQLQYQYTVEPFSQAAFALSEKNPISPVIETEFGFHLILWRAFQPEVKASIEKDGAFLRAKIVDFGRKTAVTQRVHSLMSRDDIFINEQKIADLAGIPLQKSQSDSGRDISDTP